MALKDLASGTYDSEEDPGLVQAKAFSVLQSFDENMKELGGTDSKKAVGNLHQQVAKAQRILLGNTKAEKGKIDVKLAFFCGIDARDYNRAISADLDSALRSQVSFVASRSQFNGTKTSASEQYTYPTTTERLLLKNHADWAIFARGEFLVFIPESDIQGLSDHNILEKFDFVMDGSLKRIDFRSVFSKPEAEAQLKGFTDLFNSAPKKSKLFSILGHGGASRSVAGLSIKNYMTFLEFVSHQKCKCLMINSCMLEGKIHYVICLKR